MEMIKKFTFQTNQGTFILIDASEKENPKFKELLDSLTFEQSKSKLEFRESNEHKLYYVADYKMSGQALANVMGLKDPVKIFYNYSDSEMKASYYFLTAYKSLLKYFKVNKIYLFQNPIIKNKIEMSDLSLAEMQLLLERQELEFSNKEKITFYEPILIKINDEKSEPEYRNYFKLPC